MSITRRVLVLLKKLFAAVFAAIIILGALANALDWMGVTWETTVRFLVANGGKAAVVLVFGAFLALALWLQWRLNDLLVKHSIRLLRSYRNFRKLKTQRVEGGVWLWLRGVSDRAVSEWGGRHVPGQPELHLKPDADGYQHVGEWPWDEPLACEHIEVAVLVPSSQTGWFPTAAGFDVCDSSPDCNTLWTVCIADNGIGRVYRGAKELDHYVGLPMGHWHNLRMWKDSSGIWAAVDSKVWGPYSMDDGEDPAWPSAVKLRLRTWAKYTGPMAAYGLPSVW